MVFFKWLIVFFSPTLLIGIFLLYKYVSKFRFKKVYDFNTFSTISGLKFRKSAILPKDRDFFKKYLNNTSSIYSVTLPKFDMNDYNFEGVSICNCKFTKDTILSNDKNFFQNVKNKQVIDCSLPAGDYSDYNFEGVVLHRVEFTKDSALPLKYNFFKKLGNKHYVQIKLPKSFKETCHLYDLSGVELYTKKISISDIQKVAMCRRNNGYPYSFVSDRAISIRPSFVLSFLLERLKNHKNKIQN